MPLALTDDELRIVLDCAQPIPPGDRDAGASQHAAPGESRREQVG